MPSPSEDIVKVMVDKINKLNSGLKEYPIRDLVTDTEKLGIELFNKGLKTNQIRKFLDAVNRLKTKFLKDENRTFSVIEDELVFLRPKLAYAAAKQKKSNHDSGPVTPLKEVLEAAIKKANSPDDFDRFVQMVEAVIAYHKAAGGKDQ